ncbi:MAG: hypothetical protein ACFFD2_14045 [Promethearchaeota archaeon]
MTEKKEESYFQQKLNRILDTKNDVILKDITIEVDELELELSG